MKDEHQILSCSFGNIAKLISRGLGAYLFIWGVVEVTYLPERLYSHFHYLAQSPSLVTGKLSPTQAWYLHHDDVTIAALMVRIVLLFGASFLLSRGSPAVHAYFLSGLKSDESGDGKGA